LREEPVDLGLPPPNLSEGAAAPNPPLRGVSAS
jgi:hypothetical protein